MTIRSKEKTCPIFYHPWPSLRDKYLNENPTNVRGAAEPFCGDTTKLTASLWFRIVRLSIFGRIEFARATLFLGGL
jgi:hypothetical protein